MLRTLLAERLKVSLHRGARDMTVAAISIGRDGAKLHPSGEGDTTLSADGDVMHFKGAPISRLEAGVEAARGSAPRAGRNQIE